MLSFHGDATSHAVMDSAIYMFDLFYDEAVELAEDSSPDKNDGCTFMEWLISELPPIQDAFRRGQLQALVGEHGGVKTHLYLQWVDGRYTSWLRSFRSVDGLYQSPGRAGIQKSSGKKGAYKVQRNIDRGGRSWSRTRIEYEPEVVGIMDKDWQEEPEEQGYGLEDALVDDSDDELLDEAGDNIEVVMEAIDTVKVVLCASQESVSFTTGPYLFHGTTRLRDHSDPAAREVFTRPPNMHPASKSSIEMIRRWFNECPQHGRESFFHSHRPKRLLQISGNESIPRLRLVDFSLGIPSTSTGPSYVALSYCWGRTQTNVLRHENIVEWLTNIPYDQLPQTIKDAVHITRVLGFCYLWVDAFCIIQDDTYDKNVEIKNMGGIYENADVTISASRAATCHDGFLGSRQKLKEGSFQIPFKCRDGREGTVLLWYNRSEERDEPIDHRGWTLQESLISSRTLEFGTHQTRWYCNCHHCGISHGPSKRDHHVVDGWTRDKLERSPVSIDWAPVVLGQEAADRFRDRVPPQMQRRLEKRVLQSWKRIVRNYTRRAVSDPMDRLPALSAIALRLEGLSTQSYSGGLWFGNVPRLFFWYPVDVESMRRSPEKAAPSWSWASVIGAVDFIDTEETFISVLSVSEKELILLGWVCKATIWRTGSGCNASFSTGTSDYEERHSFEGIAIMEVASIVSNKGPRYTERMYLLEVDRDGGTGLVLRKVREGLYCRAGRYSVMRRKGASLEPYMPLGASESRIPRRYFTRTRLTLI